MIQIPGSLIEFILLGPSDDRRQLQDSPILGDVWVEFGKKSPFKPSARRDLLISPYRGQHAGKVAGEIQANLTYDKNDPANIAFLQGLIAANLTFEEVMCHVVPKTKWWLSRKDAAPGDADESDETAEENVSTYTDVMLRDALKEVLNAAVAWNREESLKVEKLSALDRFLALSGILLWAASQPDAAVQPTMREQIAHILRRAAAELDAIVRLVRQQLDRMLQAEPTEPKVWQISLNRGALPALTKSIPAVKADAATTLFKVDCSALTWAVLDSGIDNKHPAFNDKDGVSRVKRSFDFKHIRKIVTLSNSNPEILEDNLRLLMQDRELLQHEFEHDEEARGYLRTLAEDAKRRGAIHWDLVEKFVEIKTGTEPRTNHGTHVAGIIGAKKQAAVKVAIDTAERKARRNAEELAEWLAEEKAKGEVAIDPSMIPAGSVEDKVKEAREKASLKDYPDFADGMCPDINLYDFRVLGGADVKDTEFAIIAALQFIRYLNDRDIFLTIHGANMSLSIPHDVRNFACGRTPICDEVERLVASGVVVVAAAGNHGYKSFETKEGAFDSYTAFSITDPGNAEGVITVGATHRFWPHTYGVSFFSSRGPTGDGRPKPDLVAPGEKIRAPLPGNYEKGGKWGDLDGTSMAAPHVSGAAAMLMARYTELVGQPRRIKHILCESATDLGRERSFQGHGMLDVLRAFQSI